MNFKALLGQGVCAAQGFRAAGVSAGIKKSGKPDLALIFSDTPATVAGTFTTNRGAAASVQVSRERVKSGSARGVVANSGCANSFTGKRGYEDAVEMSAEAAKLLQVEADEMLVCSTGLIGSFLPMDAVKSGIAAAIETLVPQDDAASQAIMTTDTRPKRSAVRHNDGWSLGGIAKGAAMIGPNMVPSATMLAFVTTDAAVEASALRGALGEAVDLSFNLITIDGDMSTNDTCLCFANGVSGVTPSADDLAVALHTVCGSLAEQIVADGEGATKFIRVAIAGAASESDARKAARRVAESLLVKTAMFGSDANWGRIGAAIGQTGIEMDPDRLSISVGGFQMFTRGVAADESTLDEARKLLAEDPEPAIECDLGMGTSSAEMVTTDLSIEYVKLNAAYE